MALEHREYEIEGWGTGEVWLDGAVLVWHELPRAPAQPPQPVQAAQAAQPGPGGMLPPSTHREHARKPVTRGAPPRADSVTMTALLDRMRRYFAGERVSFAGVSIDLDECTPFQHDLARALRAVPYGETVTYGELAALAGRPNAQRAAGTFCAHNRVPLVLPCHRVVSADGIGGYGALGAGFKRRLLELEGVRL